MCTTVHFLSDQATKYYSWNISDHNAIIYQPSFPSTDIRHPEELSLLRPVEEKKKKKDKNSNAELYDLTEVPLSSGTPITLCSPSVAWHVFALLKNI